MKIGFAQINVTIGDLVGNKKKILDSYRKLCADGADLVIYPELTITGYSPRDLIHKEHFVEDGERILQEILPEIGEVPAILGHIKGPSKRDPARYYNAILWCEKGKVKVAGHKCLLPTYGVFDEDRYFFKGGKPKIHTWRGMRIGLTVCEDIWTGDLKQSYRRDAMDPVDYLATKELDLLLNISASPWDISKMERREELLEDVAVKCGCPVVYSNYYGANDEIIFDGRSLIANPDGSLRAKLKAFEEDIRVIDLEAKPTPDDISPCLEESDEIMHGLVLGVRDYAHKIGFKEAVIGLSGGIDSAVVAAVAVEALGAENIHAYSLPSAISSEHSKSDAEALAKNLGIKFETLPIQGLVDAAEKALQPVIAGTERDETEENIQARARGLLLMAVCNKKHALLLTTGNKSELSVGYCTLYGDMAGGLAVISDVAKTKVYKLARFINREQEIIPEHIITKPPSAELSVGQLDQDSLPPYDILDKIIDMYVEQHKSSKQIAAEGIDEAIVKDIIQKIDRNEYKRQQAAPTLKVTPLSFGVERRMPIVQGYKG